jgi:hypothetical protein
MSGTMELLKNQKKDGDLSKLAAFSAGIASVYLPRRHEQIHGSQLNIAAYAHRT